MICNAKPYEGTEPYVFVCYCRKDAGMVYPLIERLARKGCRLWYDSGIHVGDEWPEAIASHLEKSAAMLIFMSEDAVNSHNCRNEVNLGIEIDKPLIPLRYNQATLTLGMRLMLSNIQWIECPEQPTDLLVDRIMAAEPMKKCIGKPDQNVLIQSFHVKEKEKEKKILHPSDLASQNRAPVILAYSSEDEQSEAKVPDQENEPEKEMPIFLPEDGDSGTAEPLADADGKDESPDHCPAFRTPDISTEEKDIKITLTPSEKKDKPPRTGQSGFGRIASGLVSSSDDKLFMNEERSAEETVVESYDPDADDLEATVRENDLILPVIVRMSTGECYRGLPGETTIGRGKLSDVRIVDIDRRISRQHVRLFSLDDIYTLTDLQSVNGTWVNGVQMERGGTVAINSLTEVILDKEKLIIAVSEYADALWESQLLVSICSEKTNETQYLFQGTMELGRNHPWKSGAMTEKKIGREHATLKIDGSACFLIDHSQNGTYMNNETERMKSGEPRALVSGDRIRMGEETFVIQCIALQKE